MGLSLDDGGHLTHGHKVSVTGKYYRAVQYGLVRMETLIMIKLNRWLQHRFFKSRTAIQSFMR